MLADIKEMLISDPTKIVDLLKEYDFSHIKLKQTEIRFARNDVGGQNISIRLSNNPGLYVKDFVTEESSDIIGYIMTQRDVSFTDVLSSIKSILNLSDDWKSKNRKYGFSGFYDAIGTNEKKENEEYPETVMDKYEHVGNLRWVKDGISIRTQQKYGVRYDKFEDLIVFPWRSATSGAIIATKARINYPLPENGMKYFYLDCGNISMSLFGFSENYPHILHCERLYVFESEKSVMIMDEWGKRTAVAVGSHSISDQQAKLIMSADPKEIWLMFDKDLPLSHTERNIGVIKEYAKMKNCAIKYWDWTNNKTICEKGAPVDMGKSVFEEICKKEMTDA